MSDTSPAVVMAAITADARALDTASSRLGNVLKDHSRVDADWNRLMQIELIKIHDAAKNAGERPPAEDLRRAMAHKEVLKANPDLWIKYLGGAAEIEALKAYLGAKKATISARQSILSALRDELRAA